MRLRLALSLILVAIVSILAVVVFAQISAAQEINTYMYRGGFSGMNLLVNSLERYYQANGSWGKVETVIATLRSEGTRQMGRSGRSNLDSMPMMQQDWVLADKNGRVLFDTRGERGGTLLDPSQEESAIRLLGRDGDTVGFLRIEGGMTFQPGAEQALLARLNTAARRAALFAGLLALALALLLGYLFLRPVQRLTLAANRIAGGDLSQRVRVTGKDELARLGEAFNKMAESLQQAQENRKAMTADIAHELRTPLAVQKAILEAIEDGVYPLDREQVRMVAAQNQSLTRLVDDLRTLALADAGELPMEMVPVEFVSQVETIFNDFKPQAALKEVELVVKVDGQTPSPVVQIDPFRISQIIWNLLNNALRHAPPGSSIRGNIEIQAHSVALVIKDQGPGIPPEALDRVFERFYRADPSRSREEGGSGLGLAIARQLARAHHGDLTARNDPAGGAEFRLTLPYRSEGSSA